MKTIAIIPARGGSKRLSNKNVKLLGGIPLLAHSINYAKQHDFIDTIYVSTDNALIKKTALEYGAQVIDRPKELSGDLEPTVTALKHVIESINKDVENVILLQATNPLRPSNLLIECFEAFEKNNSESLFTVSRNDSKLGTIKKGVFVPMNYTMGQRSQDLEPLYFENGLLYITKCEAILNNEIITPDGIPYVVEHKFANIDIDTKSDFEYAEYILSKTKTTF